MRRDNWINVRSETFNFEVKTVGNLAGKHMMKIWLEVELKETDDMVTMDLDVQSRTFKTTKCNNHDPIDPPLTITNGGIGIWSFKMNSEKLEIRQDGTLVLSYRDSCLANYVFTRIQFPDTDKISSKFRLQPGTLCKSNSISRMKHFVCPISRLLVAQKNVRLQFS